MRTHTTKLAILFRQRTNRVWIRLFRYLHVGGLVAVVDTAPAVLLGVRLHVYYVVAVAMIWNFALRRIVIFG